ncbi:MAG: hypothetical protein K0S32_2850 [Bacteroidetes bacterium]|nr:hypothetical protein [Bacteroidota bacterium]
MNEYLDISCALYSNSLTLFIGTGFSKYLTNGKAPSWLELMVQCTQIVDVDNKLLEELFVFDSTGKVTNCKYELSICAQILELEYKKYKKDIKKQVTEIIDLLINDGTIDKGKLSSLQSFFSKYPSINIITTNYDTLFSEHIIPFTSRVIIEGSVIPRINAGQNIYHIHGCISKPESLILTMNDYYKFQNKNNYFSRKFNTLLQETTVVILGYSLGDFNLNTILNEARSSKTDTFRKTDIYYITRDSVPELLSKFYETSYGIKVINHETIDRFFSNTEDYFAEAAGIISNAGNLKEIIKGTAIYNDDFLKLKVSLTYILLQASSIGIDNNDEKFLKTLISILKKKIEFTSIAGAWEQYEHLADWLIEISMNIQIKGVCIENEFCEIVHYSLTNSTRTRKLGYSWMAYRIWNERWTEMKLENQHFLQQFVKENTWPFGNDIETIYKNNP